MNDYTEANKMDFCSKARATVRFSERFDDRDCENASARESEFSQG